MKKHIPLIIVICLLVCLAVLYTINIWRSAKYYEGVTDKAIEEFVFDYEEEVIDTRRDYYPKSKVCIITVYGEKHMAVYLYMNGEIWNYDNQSN